MEVKSRYGLSTTYEMISEAKEEGTYEEMKEEIEADIKRAKYLQTISIRKTK